CYENPRTEPLDWVKILAAEARLTDAVREIAAKYKLPVASVWKALSRLADRGLNNSSDLLKIHVAGGRAVRHPDGHIALNALRDTPPSLRRFHTLTCSGRFAFHSRSRQFGPLETSTTRGTNSLCTFSISSRTRASTVERSAVGNSKRSSS